MAGAIVSETELPIPWNILMIRIKSKSTVNPPQTVATNKIIDDRIRTGLRPNTLASGTQKMFPSPRRRTLSFVMVSNPSLTKSHTSTYRNELGQILKRPRIKRKPQVPHRQSRRQRGRSKIANKGIQRHRRQTSKLPPWRPVQGICRIRCRQRKFDDPVNISAILLCCGMF